MTTLITGATGFIGGHLVKELVRRGEVVKVLVRKTSDTSKLQALGVELAYGDITDKKSVTAALQGCERLYQLAAVYEMWLPDRQRYYRVNVDGTKNVLAAALDAGVSKVVYTSTSETIGEAKGDRKTETTQHRGYHLSDYGKSKYFAEQEAMKFCQMGLPIVCVNPTSVYGPEDFKDQAVGKAIIDFLNGKLPGQFGSYINFVYIDDVVKGHILAMEKGKVGESYILAGDQDTLTKDCINLLAQLSGVTKIPRELPAWLVRVMALALETTSALTRKPPMLARDAVRIRLYGIRADNTKARTELGITFTPLREGLTRTIQWYRDNGYAKPLSDEK
jgi:dihydroflavonol-4-reductase